jgi:chromosome segregation ATPase
MPSTLDVQVRLRNIHLRNQLRKLEGHLRRKEELSNELHLIDFEQLKIENQTLNEKIEERNEELLKLRKKTTTTVQVLTHLKEKLQFVQAENQLLKVELAELEAELSTHRDALTRAKHDRDSLRSENLRLRGEAGLIGNNDLLRDFDRRKKDIASMQVTLEGLKMRHRALKEHIVELGTQDDF